MLGHALGACSIFLSALLESANGVSCGPNIGYLTARSTPQTLLSPGYPSNYENNENCRWLISTSDSSKRIQVEIVSLQLGNWDGEKCEDYLELADGKDQTKATVLGTWCDPVQVQLKTSGQHLLVTFVSDAHVTGPGFALKYYHVDEYKSECDPYGVRTLLVGDNPLFINLPMYTSRLDRDVVCDYRLKSEGNDDVTIDLELMSFNRILCDDGLEIYDGPDTESPHLLSWCYESQPFSRLSSSSRDLFIRFKITDSLSDWFVFRAKATRTFKSTSCSLKSLPNLELSAQAPTYLTFPVYQDASDDCLSSEVDSPTDRQNLCRGRACALRLWTEKQGQGIRLEVLSKDIQCGPKGVTVLDGYGVDSPGLGSLCDSRIMRGTSHNMVLRPVDGARTAQVYLKLTVLNSTCNGILQRKRALHDQLGQLPELGNSNTGQAHDLNCTYLLESDRSSDVVEVSLDGRLVDWNVYDCQGDFVTFYDGNSTSSPMLTKWCGTPFQASRVVSSGPSVLVVLTTDSYHSHQGVKMTYHALPKDGGCPKETMLVANSTSQTLTSPNYPMYYPMNSYCIYKLSAPEEQIVFFEVVHSSLENDCSDSVQLYDGHNQTYENYLGRWCGDDKPKYRSKGSKLLVVFSSDDRYNSGGFKAKFYAGAEGNNYLFPIIIGTLLAAIVASIIAVVIYICVKRKKKLQRS